MSNNGNIIEGSVIKDGNAVVTWQDKVKAYAVAAVESERPAGQFFSIRSGTLSFGGVPVPNNVMDVVVIASLHENTYYPERFDPDKPASPVCYAFSYDGQNMFPHNECSEPQSPEGCKVCKHNKFGSDPKGGRGKACKNVRRLALIAAGSLKDATAVQGATVGYLRVPVTSVAHYQRFVAAVAAKQLPPFAVVCRIKVVPDPKSMVRVEFDPLQPVDQGVLQAVLERHEVERTLIDFPYAIDSTDPSPSAVQAATKQPPPPQSKF